MVSDFYELPDLYDALLPVGPHLPFYCDLATQHPEGVLELACGTGQLAGTYRGCWSPDCGARPVFGHVGFCAEASAGCGSCGGLD